MASFSARPTTAQINPPNLGVVFFPKWEKIRMKLKAHLIFHGVNFINNDNVLVKIAECQYHLNL